MSFLQNIIHRAAFSLTKPSSEEAFALAKQDSLRPDVLHEIAFSLLYNEQPFNVQEYLFHVLPDKVILRGNIAPERLDFFQDLYANGFSEEKGRQWINYMGSVDLCVPLKGYLVHAHPHCTQEEFDLGPGFSDADKRVAHFRPFGLVEYVLEEARTDSIRAQTRLSLYYAGRSETLRDYVIEYTPWGQIVVASEDKPMGNFSVPIMGVLSWTNKAWMASALKEREMYTAAYVVDHAMKGFEDASK